MLETVPVRVPVIPVGVICVFEPANVPTTKLLVSAITLPVPFVFYVKSPCVES